MAESPDRPVTGQQESSEREASAQEQAPQSSSAERKPGAAQPRSEARTAQDFYWRRQAEKLEKELAAERAQREAEASRLAREREEAAARATEAEWRAQRLQMLTEAGLPPELRELVPEGDPETVAAYVERLKPIAEKLARPAPRGMTNTNPPNPAGKEEARLQRLGAEAARGDRRALREYAHLRERVRTKDL